MAFADLATYLALLISLSLAPGPFMALVIARSMAGNVAGASALFLGVALAAVRVAAQVAAAMMIWTMTFPSRSR